MRTAYVSFLSSTFGAILGSAITFGFAGHSALASKTTNAISASRIEIVDQSGRPREVLGTENGQPFLIMNDRGGSTLASISISDDIAQNSCSLRFHQPNSPTELVLATGARKSSLSIVSENPAPGKKALKAFLGYDYNNMKGTPDDGFGASLLLSGEGSAFMSSGTSFAGSGVKFTNGHNKVSLLCGQYDAVLDLVCLSAKTEDQNQQVEHSALLSAGFGTTLGLTDGIRKSVLDAKSFSSYINP